MPHSTSLRLPLAALRCAALFCAAVLVARAQTSITSDTIYSTSTNLGATTVSNGATLTLNGGASSGSNTSVGTGDGLAAHFVLTNGATFSNSGSFDLAGSSAESAGTATVSGSGSSLAITYLGVGGEYSWGELTVSGGASLSTGNTARIGAPASGAFTYYGTPGLGRVTVTGAGSSWTHSNGTPLSIGYGSAGELIVADGASVVVGPSSQLRIGAGYGPGTIKIIGAGSGLVAQGGARLGMVSSGTLTLADGGTFLGQLTINQLNFQIHPTINIGGAAGESAAGGGVLSLPGDLTTGGSGATLQFNTTATSGTPYYFTNSGTSGGAAPAITGYFRVINNAGYNVIAGSATYAGDTIVNGGTLKFLYGATVTGVVSGTDDISTGLSSWSTGGVFVNGGTLDLSGGTFNVSTSTGYAFTLAGGTVTNGTMSASSYSLQSGTADAVLAGAADVVKSSAGTVTLNAANTYTGSTTVSAGTLRLGHASALPSGTTLSVTSGGTLDLNGYSRTFTSSPGDGALALGSATVTFAIASDTTLATTISGAGDFVKSGVGNLTLSGASSYSGGTTINAGTLTIATGGSISHASTDVVVASTGTGALTLAGGDVAARSVIIGHDGGTATLALNGGTLTTNEVARWSVASTASFDGGTLRAAGDTSVLLNGFTSGSAVLNAGGLTIDTASHTVATPAELTGIGGLTKSGAGTLTLSGTSTYSGATTVSAGALVVNGSLANSAINVGAGATLGGSGCIGALTLASGASLAPGNSPGTLTAASATMAGGAIYSWQINDAAGVAGTNWDVLNVTGALTFTATAGDKWTFSLASLDGGNAAGLLANFNSAQSVSYLVATAAGGISGFDAAAVTLDTSGFANAFGGTWSLAVAGNDLNLNYTGVSAVPEPSTYAALAGLAALAFAAWRRRP